MRHPCPAACCHAEVGFDPVLGPDLLFLGCQEAVHATSKVVSVVLRGAGGTNDVTQTAQLCLLHAVLVSSMASRGEAVGGPSTLQVCQDTVLDPWLC